MEEPGVPVDRPSRPEDELGPHYETRAERRARRHEARGDGAPWIGGAILIAVGVYFLAQNFGYTLFGNWWALFILIPAFGLLARAYSVYRNTGRLTRDARGALFGGIILTLIALAFLFNLNIGYLWPVFLILGGLGLLINGMIPGDDVA